MLTFKNAIELAKWIKSNVDDELLQEQLMLQGVRHKQVNGTYTISL